MKKKTILKMNIVWINLLLKKWKKPGTDGELVEGCNNTQLTFITPFFEDPSFINPGIHFQGIKDCDVYIKNNNGELSTNPI